MVLQVAQLDAEKEALMARAAASQQTCAQMVVQLKAARERWHKTCLTNVALCKVRGCAWSKDWGRLHLRPSTGQQCSAS